MFKCLITVCNSIIDRRKGGDGMNAGERLAQLRQKRGWSQQKVAELTNVSQSTIAMIEKNKRGLTDGMMNTFANLYNVTTDYILGRDLPEWATKDDIIELDEMLESNVTMAYGGERLTEEEKQRVKDVLTTIFWDKVQKRKKHEEK